jgi:hypothetical protein
MELSALDPILDLRAATRRALDERPIRDRGSWPERVEGELDAHKRARAALEKADDDGARLIAAIVSASRAPIPASDAPARKRTKPRSKRKKS